MELSSALHALLEVAPPIVLGLSAAYLIGVFNLSYLWIVVLSYIIIKRHRQKRQQDLKWQIREHLHKEKYAQLDPQQFPNKFETCQWVNCFWQHAWPIIGPRLARILQSTFQDLISQYAQLLKEKGIDSLEVRSINMGTTPPVFDDVKGLLLEDGIQLETTGDYAGELTAHLGAKLRKLIGLSVGITIQQVRAYGRLRIHIKLSSDEDDNIHIAYLSFAFKSPPDYDLAMRIDNTIDAFDLPWLNKFLRRLIKTIINDLLVLPHRLVVFGNDSQQSSSPKDHSSKDDDMRSSRKSDKSSLKWANRGILRLTVVRARELPAVNRNGTSDTFVVATTPKSAGNFRGQTAVVSNTLSPVWHHTFHIPLPDRVSTHDDDAGPLYVKLSVYAYEIVGRNTRLCAVDVDWAAFVEDGAAPHIVLPLPPKKSLRAVIGSLPADLGPAPDLWMPLRGAETGDICVRLWWVTFDPSLAASGGNNNNNNNIAIPNSNNTNSMGTSGGSPNAASGAGPIAAVMPTLVATPTPAAASAVGFADSLMSSGSFVPIDRRRNRENIERANDGASTARNPATDLSPLSTPQAGGLVAAIAAPPPQSQPLEGPSRSLGGALARFAGALARKPRHVGVDEGDSEASPGATGVSGSPRQPNVPCGTLKVRLIEAVDLPMQERRRALDFPVIPERRRMSSPYCLIAIGENPSALLDGITSGTVLANGTGATTAGSGNIRRSSIAPRSTSPQWNEVFEFAVPLDAGSVGARKVVFRVMDKQKFSKDKFLGETAAFDFSVLKEDVTEHKWMPLLAADGTSAGRLCADLTCECGGC